MSIAQVNSAALRQELRDNEDIILVTTVEELLNAWKKKQGPAYSNDPSISKHSSMITSRNPAVRKDILRPNTMLCHSQSRPVRSVSNSMHTDSALLINKTNIADFVRFVDGYLADWVVPAKDVLRHVVPISKDLGFLGKVVLKTVNNTDYVIIKGYAGRRSFLTGTRYLSTHPKIMQLAVGRVGLKTTIRGGGVLTAYVTIGLELLKTVLGEKELTECGITIASDLIKIGIATIIGEAAAMMVAGTATVGAIAAGPLIVAIMVGVFSMMLIDTLDAKFKITDRVVAIIEKAGEKIISEIRNDYDRATDNIYEGIRHWIYHESGGFDIKNHI